MAGPDTVRTRGEAAPATRLDITGERCPMTFVRTRLALDRLSPGDLLEVRLRGEEPARSVPAQARALGHEVVSEAEAGGVTLLVLRKRAPPAQGA